MTDKMESCVVILDNVTRTLAKSISYFELSNYAYVLNDIDELNEIHKDMNVIIFESLLLTKASIPMLRDLRYRLGVNLILLYSDDELGHLGGSVCITKKCDYCVIDVNLIYSVIMHDDIVFEAYKNVGNALMSFPKFAASIKDEDSSSFKLLYQSLLDSTLQLDLITTERLRLQNLCSGYEATFEKIRKGVDSLQKYYDSINIRAAEYETRLTADYDKVVGGEYPERPIILYFKEFQHIQGMDILLNILHFVITVQYKHSCKVIKLLDSSNAMQARFIPDNYVFMQNTYNNRDIMENSFILKRGSYDLLFDTLLLNRSKLHILIVHDMRGCTSLALDDELIHSSVCCATSEYKDIFDGVNLLTENKKASKLYWNTSEYARMPVNERLFRLSAHPTITALIEGIL